MAKPIMAKATAVWLVDNTTLSFKQIADWTDSNVEAFSKRLSFKERIQRDQWISQCENLHREKYGSS